jgi:MarR family transcriptional regulator for hemolysin
VLTSLKGNEWPSQSDLAASVGIEGPTLTRHLDAFEQRGLVRRRPDPANRRASLVELTPEGHAMHARLREVVIAFDRHLRAGLSQEDVERLRELLGRLEENVGEIRTRG